MALGWQDIQAEALRRIRTREWAPGELIPNEAELAQELGCARATVNRALQALAEDGWVERRRRAGTRVARAPQRRAQVSIPLIRQEIADRGQEPAHRILSHGRADMPAALRHGLGVDAGAETWHTQTLYLADGAPYAFEDRWVNATAAPGYPQAALDQISPNEWLVEHAAFSHGTLTYTADLAGEKAAPHLGIPPSAPVLVLERRTFGPDQPVTHVTLTYHPGHKLRLSI